MPGGGDTIELSGSSAESESSFAEGDGSASGSFSLREPDADEGEPLNRWQKLEQHLFAHTKRVYFIVTTFLLLVAIEPLRVSPAFESTKIAFKFVLDAPNASCNGATVRLEEQKYYFRMASTSSACNDEALDFVGAKVLDPLTFDEEVNCTYRNSVAEPDCANLASNFLAILDKWILTRNIGVDRAKYSCRDYSGDHSTDDGAGTGASQTDILCGHFRALQLTCRGAAEGRRTLNTVYGILLLSIYPFVFWNDSLQHGLAFGAIFLWAVLSLLVLKREECANFTLDLVSYVLLGFSVVMLCLELALKTCIRKGGTKCIS